MDGLSMSLVPSRMHGESSNGKEREKGWDGKGDRTGWGKGQEGAQQLVNMYLPGLGFLSNIFLCPLMMLQA